MTLAQFGLFYAIGAVLIGGMVACYPKVTVKWREHELPCQRLIGALLGALLWPPVILRLLIP